MATKQQLVPQSTQRTSVSWGSLFPHDTTTIIGSEMFIKQLTALMISCITHIRGIFPEYAFEDKILDDANLKLLKGKLECKNAYLMTRWLKSLFNALDLQYMQTLMLEILNSDDQPIEYYAIDFTYANNESSLTFHANNKREKAANFTNSSVENATKKLLVTVCDATEGLGNLPTFSKVQLRIVYTDRAPPTYTPQYFQNATSYDWESIHNLKRIKMGSVNTNYHSVTLSSASTLVPTDGSDQPLFHFQNQENSLQEVQQNDNYGWPYDKKIRNVLSSDHFKEKIDDNRQSEEKIIVNNSENIVPSTSAQVSSKNQTIELLDQTTTHKCVGSTKYIQCMSTASASITTDNDTAIATTDDQNSGTNNLEDNVIKMNCMCGITLHKNDIFKCINCNLWHHWVCYKYWPDSRDLGLNYCYSCSKSNNFHCLDGYLLAISVPNVKNLMLYRQMLYKIQYIKKMTSKSIRKELNLSEYQVKKFLKKINNKGLIRQTGCQDSFNVQSQKLNKYISGYFHY